MFYEVIFRACQKRKIKYLVIGGVAVNLYGYYRGTADLDLMISLDKRNLTKFMEMLFSMGFRPKIPVSMQEMSDPKKIQKWIEEKNMKVLSVYNPQNEMMHIDIMVLDLLDFGAAYKRRKVLEEGDLKVSVLSIDDLITIKKIAGRKRDKMDIMALEKIKELEDESKKKSR